MPLGELAKISCCDTWCNIRINLSFEIIKLEEISEFIQAGFEAHCQHHLDSETESTHAPFDKMDLRMKNFKTFQEE